jgi:hypothetical protein
MTSASFFKSSRALGPGGVTTIFGCVALAGNCITLSASRLAQHL